MDSVGSRIDFSFFIIFSCFSINLVGTNMIVILIFFFNLHTSKSVCVPKEFVLVNIKDVEKNYLRETSCKMYYI